MSRESRGFSNDRYSNALIYLLFKDYKAEWQVEDGLNQHPEGLNFYEWLEKYQLVESENETEHL